MADREPRQAAATLFDRCALAFVSGLCAFLVSIFGWLGVTVLMAQFGADWLPSFDWVLAFSMLMSLLGFLLLENYVVTVVMTLWRWILKVLYWV
ncbi:MAG: hypothetical protein ACT4PZ_03680 [Panacagrimonas sp.]